jgi:hypothetical protein
MTERRECRSFSEDFSAIVADFQPTVKQITFKIFSLCLRVIYQKSRSKNRQLYET